MTSDQHPVGRLVYSTGDARCRTTLVASPGIVVALSGEVLPTLRDALWAAATSADRSLESVVQTIPLHARDGMRSFAVAVWESDERGDRVLTVVARGASVVDVYGRDGAPRSFSSQGLQPWHLASFRDVTAVRFRMLPGPVSAPGSLRLDGSYLPLVGGVVGFSEAAWIFDEQGR